MNLLVAFPQAITNLGEFGRCHSTDCALGSGSVDLEEHGDLHLGHYTRDGERESALAKRIVDIGAGP